MKASDLDRARDIAAELDKTRRSAARLAAGDGLYVVLGEGAHADRLVLASSYLERIRADLAGALAERERALCDQLAALGVDAG